jgi:hypothetical protein
MIKPHSLLSLLLLLLLLLLPSPLCAFIHVECQPFGGHA